MKKYGPGSLFSVMSIDRYSCKTECMLCRLDRCSYKMIFVRSGISASSITVTSEDRDFTEKEINHLFAIGDIYFKALDKTLDSVII